MSPPKKPSSKREQPAVFVPGTDPIAVGPPALTRLAAELVGFHADPPVYEPKTAEDLLTAYLPRFKAIVADRLELPRFDVDTVGRVLLGVYAFTQSPHVLPIYQGAAGADHFDLANLAHLRDGTLVLLHTFRKAEAAGALKSNAKVPAELDAESLDVEKRMQSVCEGFFPDDPIVQQLRPGIGYVDRAYDLFGYADVYEQKAATVAGHVLFRPTDKNLARTLAGRLLTEVSKTMNPDQKQAVDLLYRAWTFLKPVYFEVQEVGLAGLRYDPQREERFPSVYVVGRKGRGRRKANNDQDPVDALPTAPAPEGQPPQK